MSVWRDPSEESVDIYPGLTVWDSRVSGSITFGQSRLPVWAIIGELFHGEGWEGVQEGWDVEEYGWDLDQLSRFFYYLMEMRGEFGRLICLLANAERLETERADEHYAKYPNEVEEDGFSLQIMELEEGDGGVPFAGSWWDMPDITGPLKEQLQRCLDALP